MIQALRPGIRLDWSGLGEAIPNPETNQLQIWRMDNI